MVSLYQSSHVVYFLFDKMKYTRKDTINNNSVKKSSTYLNFNILECSYTLLYRTLHLRNEKQLIKKTSYFVSNSKRDWSPFLYCI